MERDTIITELERIVEAVQGNQCTTCEFWFTWEPVTSDVLPLPKFCSTVCRNEAEVAAENARRV